MDLELLIFKNKDMKNLKDFGVRELAENESSEINGGGILAFLFGVVVEMSKHEEQQAVNKAMHVLPK